MAATEPPPPVLPTPPRRVRAAAGEAGTVWGGAWPAATCAEFPAWSFFFFNDTATTEIYTLSLHDALPISPADEVARRTSGANLAERPGHAATRSEEHTSELQSHDNLVCRLLLENKKK